MSLFLPIPNRSLQGIAERPLPCNYNVIQSVSALSRRKRGFKSRRGRQTQNLTGELSILCLTLSTCTLVIPIVSLGKPLPGLAARGKDLSELKVPICGDGQLKPVCPLVADGLRLFSHLLHVVPASDRSTAKSSFSAQAEYCDCGIGGADLGSDRVVYPHEAREDRHVLYGRHHPASCRRLLSRLRAHVHRDRQGTRLAADHSGAVRCRARAQKADGVKSHEELPGGVPCTKRLRLNRMMAMSAVAIETTTRSGGGKSCGGRVSP